MPMKLRTRLFCSSIRTIGVIGIMALSLTACESSSEVLTPTATRATATSVVGAQVAVPQNQPNTTRQAPDANSVPTELPSQTKTPLPTARTTSTTQPTLTPTNTPTPVPPTPIPPTPDLQKLVAQNPQLAAIMNNPAVGAAYKDLLGAYMQGGAPGALAMAQQRGLLSPDGNVLATLQLSSDNTAGTVNQLQAMGVRVLSAQGKQISVAMPLQLLMGNAQQPGAMLTQLSGLQNVVGIMPPLR